MPTGYYLACLQTYCYVWIGTLGDITSVIGVDADLISSFCLVHRGKALIVVSETHQVLRKATNGRFDLHSAQLGKASCL